ncbi:MAG: hypothetical protein AAF555_04800 [Verrucomicrobiota bacterium]
MKFSLIAFWDDERPRSPALQMAWDEVLLRTRKEPWLRVYRWDRPCQTIGYFCGAAEARGKAPEDWVRRWTGGGLVDHGRDWAYTLGFPGTTWHHLGQAAGSYGVLHRALADVLVDALDCQEIEMVAEPESGPSRAGNCFDQPVPADLVWRGRKIAGAAQRRGRFGMLHQGSLQGLGGPSPAWGPALAERLSQSVVPIRPLELAPRVEALAREVYQSPQWNLRC